jgi:hypothetical protein
MTRFEPWAAELDSPAGPAERVSLVVSLAGPVASKMSSATYLVAVDAVASAVVLAGSGLSEDLT